MASILSSQSGDVKYGVTFTNHYEVMILSMEYLARSEDQVQSLVHRMFINEIDFHILFGGILKGVFTFLGGVLHCKSADFPAKNEMCRSISTDVMQTMDRSPNHARCAE